MIGMEASGSNPPRFDDKEERGLKSLLDAFASSFTIDEIATAYCKAGRDPDLASKFLSEMQVSASSSAAGHKPNGEAKETEHFTEPLHVVGPTNPTAYPVSAGSVSSIIGKEYARVWRPKNGFCEPTKPVKLDSNEFPESEIWGEDANSNSNPKSRRNDAVHHNMVEFLFSMLGDGFKLDRDVIREVLDACGYDMPKSVDKLFDLSTEALGKRNKSVCDSSDKFIESSSKVEVPSCRGKSINHSQRIEDRASNSRLELSTDQKQKKELERNVLVSLFGAEKQDSSEVPKRRLNTMKRAGIFGPAVSEPLRDSIVEHKTSAVDLQKQAELKAAARENEERFQVTRLALKDYRASAKQCYHYAIEEYAKGDLGKANKLIEQGHVFGDLARKADEESSKMILETRNEKENDAMLLELHRLSPKEAIRLLKTHLLSFSGFPTNLKVILETNEEDSSKGSRRRLVMKLLERESVKWIQDEDGGTISIQLACIDGQRLSFVKK